MKESNRQKKFSRLVQRELSEIMQREIEVPGNPIITPTVVRSSPDLRDCKIYVSIFPDEKIQETEEYLLDNLREIRQLLARRIGKQVRFIPDLRIFLDDSHSYAANIDQLFDKIKEEDETRNPGSDESE